MSKAKLAVDSQLSHSLLNTGDTRWRASMLLGKEFSDKYFAKKIPPRECHITISF